jgi:rubredoxin
MRRPAAKNTVLLNELLAELGAFAGEVQHEGARDILRRIADELRRWRAGTLGKHERVPMILFCPQCGQRHLDVGQWATRIHHTHACQSCGFVWRPAVVATVGVAFLPGFKDEVPQ